ncbi:hypothetical protein HQ584_08220 [Patescibacteria group bacterium]|nr:hypothetical protein [Patescibacteria group bacterium]
MKHIEVDNKVYFWVDNKTILSELPILGIKHPKNVRRFLRGIVKKEVLEYCLYKGYMPFYRIKHEKREARNMVDCPRMRKRVSFKRRGILSKDTQSFYNNTSIKNIIKDKLTKLD